MFLVRFFRAAFVSFSASRVSIAVASIGVEGKSGVIPKRLAICHPDVFLEYLPHFTIGPTWF